MDIFDLCIKIFRQAFANNYIDHFIWIKCTLNACKKGMNRALKKYIAASYKR